MCNVMEQRLDEQEDPVSSVGEGTSRADRAFRYLAVGCVRWQMVAWLVPKHRDWACCYGHPTEDMQNSN